MKLHVYGIRDITTAQFLTPIYCVNDGDAKRKFGDMVNDNRQDNPFYVHSEDFEIYHLGTFETDNGIFATGVPNQVDTGKALKR